MVANVPGFDPHYSLLKLRKALFRLVRDFHDGKHKDFNGLISLRTRKDVLRAQAEIQHGVKFQDELDAAEARYQARRLRKEKKQPQTSTTN